MSLSVILVTVLSVAVFVNGQDASPTYDGRPGCLVQYEFGRLWKNNFEPTAYWKCEQWGQPASKVECPKYMNFQDYLQMCVPYTNWKVTPFSEPPTGPGQSEGEQCKPIPPPSYNPCPTCPPCNSDPTTPLPTTTPSTTTPTTTVTTTTQPPCPTCAPPTETTPPCSTCPPTTPTSPAPQPDPVVGTCPGATLAQHAPGNMDCNPFECTKEKWENGTLYPTHNPTEFFQCRPTNVGSALGTLQTMECPKGTCFSFEQQVCVHVVTWKNPCKAQQ
ncbi:hypothetical protein DMENIID0001_115920 [Sergentomyia squamirostris]